MSETPSATLRDPSNRVDPRARWLWTAGAALQAVVVAVVGVLVGPVFSWVSLPWWLWLLFVVVAAAYLLTMPTIRYRVHRWETTETAVYTQRGWITRERRVAPMSRVQTVELEQGPIERLLRLATVTVTTASAAGPLSIEGLDARLARGLVDTLTARAEIETDDAT